MATHPIGKGTQTVGINMSIELAKELDARAQKMHISKSRYCKLVLQSWVDSGRALVLSENGMDNVPKKRPYKKQPQ